MIAFVTKPALTTSDTLRYEPVCEPRAGRHVDCPNCNGITFESQIVESPAVASADHDNRVVIPCRIVCHHCNILISWLAGVDLQGNRTCEVVSGPGIIRGRKMIAKFLQKHPGSCETAPM